MSIIDLIVDLGLPLMLIYGDSDMIRLDHYDQRWADGCRLEAEARVAEPAGGHIVHDPLRYGVCAGSTLSCRSWMALVAGELD